ncbi:hypothetical protein [Thermogemmatispora tikiterensis]|uniref:hypothetical protein n=1 Tax=Thermogemmatispora tikiterensis TaxID=1825093 RepID=UPI000DD9860F|nr:hypothetical protein [Thermogemmatispora tikiterensis]
MKTKGRVPTRHRRWLSPDLLLPSPRRAWRWSRPLAQIVMDGQPPVWLHLPHAQRGPGAGERGSYP